MTANNRLSYINMETYTDLFNPTFLKSAKTMPVFPENISLAMAYIPYQEGVKVYETEEGLFNGTIFPCLNKQFCGRMVDTK